MREKKQKTNPKYQKLDKSRNKIGGEGPKSEQSNRSEKGKKARKERGDRQLLSMNQNQQPKLTFIGCMPPHLQETGLILGTKIGRFFT